MYISEYALPWVEFINKCTELVHGEMKITTISGKHPQMIANITFKYNGFNIDFSQEILINTVNLVDPHSLIFKCQFDSADDYSFSCTPLGLIDKLFNPNRYRSEFHEVNRQFFIETSDERLTDKLLKVNIFRHELLTNKVFLLHSMSNKGKTTVSIKILEGKFYSIEEFGHYTNILNSVLDLMSIK